MPALFLHSKLKCSRSRYPRKDCSQPSQTLWCTYLHLHKNSLATFSSTEIKTVNAKCHTCAGTQHYFHIASIPVSPFNARTTAPINSVSQGVVSYSVRNCSATYNRGRLRSSNRVCLQPIRSQINTGFNF